MGCLEPLLSYQKTDPKVLLQYADELFHNSTFHQYLTPPQLIVLNRVLTIQNRSHKEEVWKELIRSNMILDVVKKQETETSLAPESNCNANTESSEVVLKDEYSEQVELPDATDGATTDSQRDDTGNVRSDVQSSQDSRRLDSNQGRMSDSQGMEDTAINVKKEIISSTEPDFSEVDLENLQQQMGGTEFIGNLSLKIRYVLWESAIEPLCEDLLRHKEAELPFNVAAKVHGAHSQSARPSTPSTVIESQEARDEDEDDDYDDEDDNKSEEKVVEGNQDPDHGSLDLQYDECGRLIFILEISKSTLSVLGVNNSQAIIENFNKIYHNFENDRETLLKRIKLEESDKLLEPPKKRKHTDSSGPSEKEEEDDSFGDDVQNKKAQSEGTEPPTLSVNLGSANLSLKHLLASIQENKSKLDISDYELRHLIMDVRKNRSKWASDDKIGQEELYDACEKVVLELRNYTEHSTAFLNKVSKREAPNYYQIIKKPMDLNTVLKKLKTFQYTSKQAFVDDVMLIWKNCLAYNSDPKHFLRTHAIAMQKKSLALIPLIPDITIRDRSEVEKELEDIDRENDKDYEAEEESGTGRKGGNIRGIKHEPADKSAKSVDHAGPQDGKTPSSASMKGRMGQKGAVASKKHFSGENDVSRPEAAFKTSSHSAKDEATKKKPQGATDLGGTGKPQESDPTVDLKEQLSEGAQQEKGNEEEEEEDEEDEDDEGESNMYLVERDDDKDDIEISTWKSCTATVRADLCIKRANLFKGHKLNSKAPAILRNPGKMKEFDQFLKEYKEQQEAEIRRRKMEQESIMKNGFGAVIKQEEEDNASSLPQQNQSINHEGEAEKQSAEIELDDANFLTEYNVANSLPALAYKGVDETIVDHEESKLVENILSEGSMQHSSFLANKDKGLNPKINANIQLIQEVRHICHKIALIRMLQNPQNPAQQVKNNSPNPNNPIWDSHKYKFTCIDDELDLDPVSRLPTRNQKHDKELIWRLMRKNVAKIAMSNGFESTQPVATNMLTEIAGEYLSNLIKTVKLHHESTFLNPKSSYEILQMSLLENGITKPDDLYSYMEAEFVKKNNKLKDIKSKLNNFLKELLRPTLQDLSERNFEDESQSFMTGDFSSEITGEDFFGFKDLGLDREFGVLSNSVPMQLLTFQFQGKGLETKVQDKKIQPEEFNDVVYSDVTAECVRSGTYWNTLQPLLEKAFNRFKNQSMKNNKQRSTDNALPKFQPDDNTVLPEDDEIPSKSKSSGKPRLPPTGKINTNYKKKALADGYFTTDSPPQQAALKRERSNEESIMSEPVGEPTFLHTGALTMPSIHDPSTR